MLVHASRKARVHSLANCFLARGDGQSLPFANGTFDFILMSQVLHFFQDRPRAAAEVRRVSTANARLAVITASHRQLRAQVDLGLFPGMMKREAARIPSIPEIRRVFEDQGFELHNTTEYAATFYASSAEALVKRVAGKPWSSYLLFGEEELATRLKGFRRRLRGHFGSGEIAYLVPQTLMFFRRA
jgi:ubiquinone/menaquinone biosynthesis C-methylase UbiE